MQPDQAPPAALQHRPARRQILPLHLRRQGDAPSSPFRASAAIAAPSARTATISARSPPRARSTRRSARCCARSRCAPAPTASSRTAPGPACSTRSSAARRPASAASRRPTTRSCSSRPRRSSPAAASKVRAELQAEMAAAAEALDFEQAAAIRDRLKALAHITSRQGINVSSVDDADVVALAQDGGQACVQVFFYRNGRNYGNRAYYPSHAQDAGPAELLEAFLGQFYSERPPPRLILLSDPPASQELLSRGAVAARRAQGRAGLPAARRAAPADRAGGEQRAPGARPQARREQRPGEAAAAPRRAARPAGAAGAGRGLRQQPHHGHRRARRLHRRRPGGAEQGRPIGSSRSGARTSRRATTTR